MHLLLSLVTGNTQGGLERAYEALGITLARNGEPKLQQFGEKYPTILQYHHLVNHFSWAY